VAGGRVRLDVEVDERYWAHLPGEFPSDGYADRGAWERDIVARYLTVRPDADDATRAAAAGVAEAAVDGLMPSALFGLLFWPTRRPEAALLHVDLGPTLRAGDDPVRELLDGVPTALPPSVDPVEVPGIGRGVAVRFVLPAAPGETPVAGIGYVLSGPQGSVRIVSSPTSTTMVGMLDAPLRELVGTLRFVA